MKLSVSLAVLCLLASGCDCGDDVKIEIVEPQDGDTLNYADDVDAAQEGVQIVVLAATEGLDLGESVHLDVAGTDYPASVGTGGTVRFDAVTLQDGENLLKATASGASSSAVTVTLEPSSACPDLTISAPSDGATLRGEDDEDGEACGEFVYTVVASTSAQEGRDATLLVNGNDVGSAQVAGAEIRFSGITLDSGANALEVRLDGNGDCSAVASVTVDCGVTCTIGEPAADTLNAESDQNADPGLQVDVVVETDAEDGQEVTLIVDDDTESSSEVASGRATFSDTSLAEGERSVQAVCRDAAGNEARSARVRFTVDTVPPEVEVDQPHDGDQIGMSQDFDGNPANGLQVEVCATSDAEGSELCAALAGAEPGPDGCAAVTDGRACGVVDCAGAVNLEAAVSDEAGNEATASVSVTCYSTLPVVVIADPSDDAILAIPQDADAVTPGLQYQVRVCSDAVGGAVELFSGGTSLGTATVEPGLCDADGLAQPVDGTARLDVTIPEGLSVDLQAHVVGQGANEAWSAVVVVMADSIAPTVTFFDPLCGTVLGPDDDADGVTPGIQRDVWVRVSDIPADGSVTGSITWEGGGGAALRDDGVVLPGNAVFSPVTFQDGVNLISVPLTDPAGNSTAADCSFTANQGGVVRIDSPTVNARFDSSGDGNSGVPGFQGAVVRVYSDGPADGTMSVCVDADGVQLACVQYLNAGGQDVNVTLPEGAGVGSTVVLQARTVNHPGGLLTSNPVSVLVDTLPPATPANLTVSVADHRAGTLELSFTAPADPVGRRVTRYVVRWDTAQIANEITGNLIQATGNPLDPGSPQVLSVTGLSPERSYYFAVRAEDGLGNAGISAFSSSTAVSLTYDTIDSPNQVANYGFGLSVAGGASVNGDEYADIVVGTSDATAANTAFVYFGGPAGIEATPDVTITSGAGTSFGYQVAMLEDFNGDGLGDIAIADHSFSGSSGRVYLFFGRDPFPAALTVADADVTIRASAGEFMGYDVATAGDLNNDNLTDLVIGAPGLAGFNGGAFVILGDANPPLTMDVPGDENLQITGTLPVGFVFAVAPAGDVDNDGFDDFLIATCNPDPPGEAYLFLGETAAAMAADPARGADEAAVILAAPAGAGGFGCGLGGVGDVDGDGYGDVVIGAPNAEADDSGAFYIYPSDGLGGLEAEIPIVNDLAGAANQFAGLSVAWTLGLQGAAAPSFDSGLTPDIAVAQFGGGARGFGQISTYWGPGPFVAGDVANAPLRISGVAGSFLTIQTAGYAGDVDADGFVDLFIGDPSGTGGRTIVVR